MARITEACQRKWASGLGVHSHEAQPAKGERVKTQNGTIKRIGKSWCGRWREDAIVNGTIQRVQRFVKLAEFDDRYRAKADVRPLLAEKLSALNVPGSSGRWLPLAHFSLGDLFQQSKDDRQAAQRL
jgi:hypothetical protein